MVFLASTAFAQKTQKTVKADSLITPTDTLVFLKDTVRLSKLELLVRQAIEKQNKPLDAIALYKKALAAKTKTQDSNWVADVRLGLAKMYFKLNDDREGFLHLLAAQALYTQSSNISCQSAITKDIARIYEGNNDWTEAEKYYELAIKQQESIGLTLDMPYTSLDFANGYYKRKDYVKAEKYYSSALNQFELNGEKNKRAEALVQLADIKVKQKNYAQAEHLILKRAMPFFSSVGKPAARVACFNMLGDIYYIQSRHSEAKWFYIQAYTMYNNQADVDGVIRSMVNLAKVKCAIGDKKAALKDFKDAEAMAMKRKNLALAADVKVAMARYYNKPKAKAAEPKLSAAVVVKKTIVPVSSIDSVKVVKVKPVVVGKTLASSSTVKKATVSPVVAKKDTALVKKEKSAIAKEKVLVASQVKEEKSSAKDDKSSAKEEKAIVKEEKSSGKDGKLEVAEN